MSDQTLLTGIQSQTDNQEATPQSGTEPTPSPEDNLAILLASITNEEGQPKYKDVPTALEALKHSQAFIPELKGKNDELLAKVQQYETELGKQNAVTDFINQLQSTQGTQEQTPEKPSESGQALTLEDVEKLIAERESKKLSDTNIKSVSEKILAAHGEKTEEFLTNRSKELGMSMEDLNTLAAKSPQAALALLGQTSSAPKPTGPTSSVNSGALPTNQQSLEAPRPTTSMMRGAKTKDLNAYMQELIAHTNAKYNG